MRIHALAKDVLRALVDHWRPLLAYHLAFTLLASLVLLPAIAWSLATLLGRLGRPVIATADLAGVLLTPTGGLWLLATLALTFLVLYLQQAGMILVAASAHGNRYRRAFDALGRVLWRLPRLAGLATLQVGTHLLLLAPFALAVALLYGHFLGELDPYYVQRTRPPALWAFVASALLPTLAWAVLAAGLYLRWSLALPALILEDDRPRRALARSWSLTRGHLGRIALVLLALLGLILALPPLSTWAYDLIATPLVAWLPERPALLVPAMLLYLAGYLLLTLALTFLGLAANSLLAAALFLRLSRERLRLPRPGAHPERLAWALEVAVVLALAVQATLILNRVELHDEVAIIAHRGSSMAAPENSLPAIERAIADGSDYVELDVRLTADDRVVLYHDQTLQRLAGDPRRVGELSLEELGTFDLGSWFGDAYEGLPIATLEEALVAVRGQAALMIDLKPDPGRELALVEAVLNILEREEEARRHCHQATTTDAPFGACGDPEIMAKTRLATLSPALMGAIAEREPKLRITLLAQLILPGTLERQGFAALGLRHNRISQAEVRLARDHGYEIHAWTVNDPARMSQLIDLGVDAIITDRPDLLATLLAERRELSDGELLLIKLRNWLRQ
ncbi:glycerophosphodiester phosphodiesterase family protein [Halomonas salifodinae]|uniref:glycerophosphodiester phosphodiesterase family protein n=1 Tax=Halomonas salifodinae TaxID=438745 RepID=UPI0033B6B47C